MSQLPAVLRQRGLGLYRQALRAARQWEGPDEEKQYIREEAGRLARENASLSDAGELDKKLEELQGRLDIALHYKIPYPRLYHADQFEKVPYLQAPRLEEPLEAAAAGAKDPDVAAKLAAAARRRRERIAAQRSSDGGGG